MGLLGGKRHNDPSDSEYGPPAWWSVTCKSDPRFNGSGQCYSVIGASFEVETHIKKKIAELGLKESEVPADIEYSGGKP